MAGLDPICHGRSETNMRHDRATRSFLARTLSLPGEAARERGRFTPRTGAFARASKNQGWFGRRRAGGRVLRQRADMGRWCVPYAAAVRLKKPAGRFHGPRAPELLR